MDKADQVIQQAERDKLISDKLAKARVDMQMEYLEPENAVTIKNRGYDQRFLTLGNFSTIIGKQKSKKTALTSLIIAAASTRNSIGKKFIGKVPEGKRKCWYFDTEQAIYDSWKVGKRIEGCGGDLDNIEIICLRPYTPKERLEIIDYSLREFGDESGFVVIDGIADLVGSVNDEAEAIEVGTKLLNWTAVYNLHITVIIHQRKADNYARGHIGTVIMNKSEMVIRPVKDESDPAVSFVKCDDSRSLGFDEFDIEFTAVGDIIVRDKDYSIPSRDFI